MTRAPLFRFVVVLALLFGAWHVARDHLGPVSDSGGKCAYCVLGATPSILAAAPVVPVPAVYTISWLVLSAAAILAAAPMRRAIRGPPYA